MNVIAIQCALIIIEDQRAVYKKQGGKKDLNS